MAQSLLTQQRRSTNEQIFKILFENDELTWKQIIFGLIEAEEMDPWDIDLSLIAQRFLEMLKTLKKLDFRISGKMVLASAILLKMKSTKLIDEEIAALDNLINSTEESEIALFELPDGTIAVDVLQGERPKLFPKTPQPRKRKVSVYDLIEALEQALEVDAKRVRIAPKMIKEAKLPENKVDMHEIIKSVYDQVNKHYEQKNAPLLTFDDLVPSDNPQDRVLTFIPLLHLDCQRKVDVLQDAPFTTIAIALLKKNATFSNEFVAE